LLSSPYHSIEKLPQRSYFLVWGRGKQALIVRLHCTGRAVCKSSGNRKSTSGGGEECRSALYVEGHASEGCSQLVSATGLGNPSAVQYCPSGSVRFGSRIGHKHEPKCLWWGGYPDWTLTNWSLAGCII
jgi:hypothetical protein